MSKLFRGLIALQVLSIIALVLTVPADQGNDATMSSFMATGAIAYFILFVMSLILLFRYKPVGRTIFSASVVFGIVLTLVVPQDSVPTGNLVHALNWLAAALDGAMLVMIYLTSLSERFKSNSSQVS
ncbi:hypothetical protein N9399_02505 [Porticoccaceae bacterium]|nr:hypothetical protein [Porticoccaceae bacterium]